MDMPTLRFNVQTLTKAYNKESDPIVKKYLLLKVNKAKQAFANAKRFDSALKPCRTPWKRLISPNKYFEALS